MNKKLSNLILLLLRQKGRSGASSINKHFIFDIIGLILLSFSQGEGWYFISYLKILSSKFPFILYQTILQPLYLSQQAF